MPHGPQIPLTPQTDERNFPKWEANAPPGRSGSQYPKLLTRNFTEEDKDAWVKTHRKFDVGSRAEYFDERVPDVGAIVPIAATAELVHAGLAKKKGDDVVVADAEDEKTVREMLGLNDVKKEQLPAKVSIPIQASPKEQQLIDELTRLRAEKAKLELDAKSKVGLRKSTGRGWSAKRRAAQEARRLSPEEFAESE